MTRRLMVIGLVAASMLGGAPLSAHDEYRIIGTVTKVTATDLEVKQTKDGKTISMALAKDTVVTRDKKKVARTQLKTGLSVVVDAVGDSMVDLEVVEVRIVPPPAKK